MRVHKSANGHLRLPIDDSAQIFRISYGTHGVANPPCGVSVRLPGHGGTALADEEVEVDAAVGLENVVEI